MCSSWRRFSASMAFHRSGSTLARVFCLENMGIDQQKGSNAKCITAPWAPRYLGLARGATTGGRRPVPEGRSGVGQLVPAAGQVALLGPGQQPPASVGVLRSEEHRLNSSHHSISYAVFCLKK